MTNACFVANRGVLEMLKSNWRAWRSERDQVCLYTENFVWHPNVRVRSSQTMSM